MPKKKLKKQKSIKKTKTKKISSWKITGRKKVIKKRTVKKPVAKKTVGKKKTIKKSLLKKSEGKTVLGKAVKHKTVAKKPENLKNLPKKNKVSNKKSLQTKGQITKKSPVVKGRSVTSRSKPRNSMPSLNYRERELKNLLEKEKEEKLILRDMEGRTYCAVENCDYPALVEDYCRIHFFGLFKVIKKKKQILEQDLLSKSYLLLFDKYSESVFEYLFKDLSTDKDFRLAVKRFTDEETDDPEMEEVFSD